MPTRNTLKLPFTALRALLLLAALALFVCQSQAAQDKTTKEQLPDELKGAKIYQLPESDSAQAKENMVVLRSLGYQDIGFDHLSLDLLLSVRPVDRDATIRRIYFQDMSANGFPLHIGTFETEFKVSKKGTVDFPRPLTCKLVFADLESLLPLRDLVAQDKLHVTGKSFVEVKLNAVEKLALRTKQLVIPVDVSQDVPFQMFSGNPLLQVAATNILDTLNNPYSMQALALAKEHVARLTEHLRLEGIATASLYFVYCSYGLRDPETKTTEIYTQSGTAFLVAADGKLLTTKSVIQPWKFDPQMAFLMSQRHFDLDPRSYNVVVWQAGSQLRGADGQLGFAGAASTANGNLKVLKTPTDAKQKADYTDADSGKTASVQVNSATESNFVLLQVAGGGFRPLTLTSTAPPGPDQDVTLLSFPFGMNQQRATPQEIPVQWHIEASRNHLDHSLNPGESGGLW